jgi:Zn ribbon nucleic-acid-binding protein
MFIKLTACPACQKRGNDKKGDNLAEYTENYYCMACGYYKRKNSLNRVRDLTASNELKSTGVCDGITLNKTLATEAKKWLLGYGLSDEDMKQFTYDYENDVLYLYTSDSYRVGRFFAKDTKTRYISKGRKPVLTYGIGNVCVLVEDILSAIKVGRQYAAIPMLGAKPTDDIVNALKGYESVVLWGDADKMRENIVVRNKLSERLNKPVKLCFTSLDPKCYSDLNINYYINNCFK